MKDIWFMTNLIQKELNGFNYKDGIVSSSIFGSQEGAQNRLFYALEQLD
jgi:hypothetical protein